MTKGRHPTLSNSTKLILVSARQYPPQHEHPPRRARPRRFWNTGILAGTRVPMIAMMRAGNKEETQRRKIRTGPGESAAGSPRDSRLSSSPIPPYFPFMLRVCINQHVYFHSILCVTAGLITVQLQLQDVLSRPATQATAHHKKFAPSTEQGPEFTPVAPGKSLWPMRCILSYNEFSTSISRFTTYDIRLALLLNTGLSYYISCSADVSSALRVLG